MSNPEAREKLDSFMAENLRTKSHALLAIGLSLGINIEEGDIAQSVEAQMADILEETFAGDRDAYIQSLYEGYLTDRYIRTFVAVENYLSVEVIKTLLQDGKLDDSDETAMAYLLAGYGEGEDIANANFVHVRQVYIESDNAGGAEKAKLKAEALRAVVAAATTDEERNKEMLAVMSESRDFQDVGYGHYFARGEMAQDYENAVFALPVYGVSEVIPVEGGYCFVMRLPMDQQYIEENLENLKAKTYYVTLNAMIDDWMAKNPLIMTDFGKSLDPAALEMVEPDGGEGMLIAIPLIVGALVLLVAIFVIRVLVLRARMKKGKPVSGKKKKTAKR